MSVKSILQDFSKEKADQVDFTQLEAEIQKQLLQRRDRLTHIFETVILPSVYSVERDLQQAGFWHVLQLQQISTEGGEKPHIVGVLFFFYPEKIPTDQYNPKMLEAAYRADIFCTEDYRKVTMTLAFPVRFPPRVDIEERLFLPEEVTTEIVDDFLEAFIKGAIDVYRSDRTLL